MLQYAMTNWNAPLLKWNPKAVPRVEDGHLGAFSVERKFHFHEGVDLYCKDGSSVFAVESGTVVAVRQFTGEALGHTWWNDTHAVFVLGETGIVVYGEISPKVAVGDTIDASREIGTVVQVLKKDKGRPMAMLHIELRAPHHDDSLSPFDWSKDLKKPVWLLDPTPYLLTIGTK